MFICKWKCRNSGSTFSLSPKRREDTENLRRQRNSEESTVRLIAERIGWNPGKAHGGWVVQVGIVRILQTVVDTRKSSPGERPPVYCDATRPCAYFATNFQRNVASKTKCTFCVRTVKLPISIWHRIQHFILYSLHLKGQFISSGPILVTRLKKFNFFVQQP